MIQNLFYKMTGITPEMTGKQHYSTAVHPTKPRGNASKKIDYLPFLLTLLF
jgi:hypothetical protein